MSRPQPSGAPMPPPRPPRPSIPTPPLRRWVRLAPSLTAAFTGALLALLALGSPATASHVSCGAVLNTDTTLDSDLSDCPGSGVVIGASDITVDLGGHTIDGSGTGAGVDNGGGYDRVTVRNG